MTRAEANEWRLLPSVGTWCMPLLEEASVKQQLQKLLAAASFADLDANQDGIITRQEFEDFVQQATEMGPEEQAEG